MWKIDASTLRYCQIVKFGDIEIIIVHAIAILLYFNPLRKNVATQARSHFYSLE